MRHLAVWFVLGLAFVGGVGAGDSGDDFSNNLFSDLAPLLALFGERVTMQFMSQSMGWSDNVVLAMCPLGIITAIIGAIRTGGSPWLKALIGRARESKAIAEAELMSSTSKEVCELWNGSEIVRVMGNAPIREFIVLIPPGASSTDLGRTPIRVGEMKDGIVANYLEEYDRHAVNIFSREFWRGPRHDKVHLSETGNDALPKCPTEILVVRNTDVDAPNLTLNAHDQVSRGELRIAAIFGVLLQSAVLAYFVVTVHWLKMEKDGGKVQSYALPCAVIGTVFLALGMLLCGHVVESSTHEKTYRVRHGCECRIVWLQKPGIVNDQSFESYAVFPQKPRLFITVSQRASGFENFGTPFGKLLPSKALAGTAIGLSGFMLQFIGLRGLPWTASIAQLIGIMTMAILRSILRRGLSNSLWFHRGFASFELDWLAMSFADLLSAPWRCVDSNPEKRDDVPWKDISWHDSAVYVSKPSESEGANAATNDDAVQDAASPPGKNESQVCQGPDEHTKRLAHKENSKDERKIEIIDQGAPDSSETNGSHEENSRSDTIPTVETQTPETSSSIAILNLRTALGRLSKWPGSASIEAITLARSIEIALEMLLDATNDVAEWRAKPKPGDPIVLKFQKINSSWKVFSDRFDALLSLWLFSVRTHEDDSHVRTTSDPVDSRKSMKHSRQYRASPPRNPFSEDADDAWLNAERGKSKQTCRVLGQYTPALHRDLLWWMPTGISTLRTVELHHASSSPYEIEMHRLLHSNVPVDLLSATSNDNIVKYSVVKTPDLLHPRDCFYGAADKERHARLFFMSHSYQPLSLVYAQEIFSSFLLGFLHGGTNPGLPPSSLIPDPADWQRKNWENFRLKNDWLDAFVERLSTVGLGTAEDTLCCLLPTLGKLNLLPDADCVIEWVRDINEESECRGLWSLFGRNYLWLFALAESFPSRSTFAVRATALFLQYTVEMVWEEERLTRMDFGYDIGYSRHTVHRVDEMKDYAIKRGDRRIIEAFDILKSTSKLEGRLSESLLVSPQHQAPNFATGDLWVSISGLTPLHLAAILSSDSALYRTSFAPYDLCVCQVNRDFRGAASAELNAPDIRNWTPLHYAAALGARSKVVLLLAAGANPDSRNTIGRTAMYYAVHRGDLQITLDLISSRADCNSRDRFGKSPLHFAAAERVEMVQAILEAGADPNVVDLNGHSPLHVASWRGNEEVIKLLLPVANIKLRDIHGRTVHHLACISGNLSEDSVLAQHINLHLNIADRGGNTPLTCAAYNSRSSLVTFLLNAGANAGHFDTKGRTPLYIAAMHHSVETVRSLIQHTGTAATLRSKDGRLPWIDDGDNVPREIMKMLRDAGALDMHDRISHL